MQCADKKCKKRIESVLAVSGLIASDAIGQLHLWTFQHVRQTRKQVTWIQCYFNAGT